MKTSLVLDDRLFREAQREARQTGRTISDTINEWARLGHEAARQRKPRQKPVLKPVDMGAPVRIDLTRRVDWLDRLDDDRD